MGTSPNFDKPLTRTGSDNNWLAKVKEVGA